MSEGGLVLESREGGIVTLTLNDPERRNALAAPMTRRLLEIFTALQADKACRAVVIAANGSAFSAGGDLAAMKGRSDDYVERRLALGRESHPLVRLMVTGLKPVVAAVEGPAFGAGLALAAACDYIVAGPTARFCVAQMRVGLVPDMGVYWTLKQRVGGGFAREMVLLAREVKAEEAFQRGLVNQVAEPPLAAALAIAEQFARLPPLSIGLAKAALSESTDTLSDTFRAEKDLQPMLYRTRDHKEAVAAFFEKRRPTFNGD